MKRWPSGESACAARRFYTSRDSTVSISFLLEETDVYLAPRCMFSAATLHILLLLSTRSELDVFKASHCMDEESEMLWSCERESGRRTIETLGQEISISLSSGS